MAKTKEELMKLKEEVCDLAGKVSELSEDELKSVVAGEGDLEGFWDVLKKIGEGIHSVIKPVVK